MVTLIYSKMNTLITKSSLNTLVLTVSELSRDDLPKKYLFRFTNDQTQEQTVKYLPLVTTNDRYDLFHLLEGTDVTFDVETHKYEVFQVADENETDPANGILVETGKIEVVEQTVEYIANEVTTQTIVYESGGTGS